MLGRNAGIAVAAHDYLTNIRDEIPEAGIISEPRLEQIAEAAVKDSLAKLFDKVTIESLLEKEVRRYI